MTKIIKINLKSSNYKVIIESNLLDKVNIYHKKIFKNRPKILAFDKNLYKTTSYNKLINKLGKKTPTISIKPGEETKSIKGLEKLYDNLILSGLNRDTVIYSLGGGVIGDLVGFAAATILRGVDYVQIPTTLLSQIDSSVGGKTAINNRHGKNLIGAFYHPKLVLIDINTLSTLSLRQMKTGYAEMVKYAIINDLKFFNWLEINGKNIIKKDNLLLEKSIYKCVTSKAKIVSKDEKEKNQRALLNLGHTFAHAFEKNSKFKKFTHGEAVSVGMIFAAKLSSRLKYCKIEEAIKIEQHLKKLKLPTRIENLFLQKIKVNDLIHTMRLDKKSHKGIIRFILIKKIGSAFICDEVKEKNLRKFLRENGAI